MPTPPATPTPTPTNALPRGWTGGRLEGIEEALVRDWHDAQAHGPELHRLHADWGPFEADGVEPDPPGPVGFDVSSVGPRRTGGAGGGGAGGGGRAPAAVVRGTVRTVSKDGGGIILVGTGDPEVDGNWANSSRFADPPVDFSGLRRGQAVEVELDTASSGRRYVRRLTLLPAEGDQA